MKHCIAGILIGITLGILLLWAQPSAWSSPAVVFAQERSNTYYAAQFAGPDVGTKVTNAQNSCSPNTAIQCIIVIDAILAGWPQGTVPAPCAQCIWMDWSHGAGRLFITTNSNTNAQVVLGTQYGSADGLMSAGGGVAMQGTGLITWGLNTSISQQSNGVVQIGTGAANANGSLALASITVSGNITPLTPGGSGLGTAGAPFSLVAVGSGTNTEHRILSSSTANRIMTIPDGTAGAVVVASFTTTAAATDNVTVQGMVATGHCSLTPTNSGAAGGIASVFVSAKNTNQITVTHTATAGWTFDVMCTI